MSPEEILGATPPAVATWTTKALVDSTFANSASNSITLTMRPSVSVCFGATISLVGITGSLTGTGSLALTGAGASLFTAIGTPTGAWTVGSGTLVLTPNKNMQVHFTVDTVVTFTVQNPAAGQQCRVPTLEASLPAIAAVATDGIGVLAGTSIMASAIIEDTAVVNALANVLSVTIQPTNNVCAGGPIVISGLSNSVVPDNVALPIAGTDAARFVGPTGSWTKLTGTLVLTVAIALMSNAVTTEFTIPMINPGAESCGNFPLLNGVAMTGVVLAGTGEHSPNSCVAVLQWTF